MRGTACVPPGMDFHLCLLIGGTNQHAHVVRTATDGTGQTLLSALLVWAH